jgi:hypothetical protein
MPPYCAFHTPPPSIPFTFNAFFALQRAKLFTILIPVRRLQQITAALCFDLICVAD